MLVGAEILASYAPVAILFGLYTVTAAILQGIDRHKWIVFTSLLGLLFKLALNIPLIKLFETNGAILATAIGYTIAVGINIAVITKVLHYRSTDGIQKTDSHRHFKCHYVYSGTFTLKGSDSNQSC